MKRYDNGIAQINSALSLNSWPNNNHFNNPFNQSITRAIEKGRAYVASDASASDNEIAGH